MMPRLSQLYVRRLLKDVPEEHVFRCQDGAILRNMRDLRDALINMTDEVFTYHSGNGNSEFSDWARNILADRKLANNLGESVSRMRAARIVAERVAFLSSKLPKLSCEH